MSLKIYGLIFSQFSQLLQIKFLVARGTLGVLGTDLTNQEDAAHSLALWTQTGSYVLWGGFDDFLCFSSTHYILLRNVVY